METSCWKTCQQHKHRNKLVIFFYGGNSAKQAKTQQSGETDGEKRSADGKARKSYAKKKKKLTGYKSLNFTGYVKTMQKIYDVQYLYTAKENKRNDLRH